MPGLSASDKQKILRNVPKATSALRELLPTINPLLKDSVKVEELQDWVESLVSLVLLDAQDLESPTELGQQLEIMDSFQPVDLLRVQQTLHHTLVSDLPSEVQLAMYPTLMSTLVAVTGGFYIGKAHRAAAINMSAASKMGHDLKTPINAITGFSHVILKEIDGPITPFQKEDLTSIHEAGKKLLAMVNDLSAALKQDASRFGLYPAELKVSDLVAEVIANIHPIYAVAGHILTIKLVKDLGTIRADASKIRWILLSLLMYLSRLGEDWQISLSVDRQEIVEQSMVVFQIHGYPADSADKVGVNTKQVSSTEMINRDVALATCWRFCTSIGASLEMTDGLSTAFILQIPTIGIPNDIY